MKNCLHFALALSFFLPGSVSAASLKPILDRYVASVLPADPAAIQRLQAQSATYAESLKADGTWPDIDYALVSTTVWGAGVHLERTLVMAKSARLYHNTERGDLALDAKVILAIETWMDHGFLNPNWWWNQIGVPQLSGEIAALMWPQLPDTARSAVVEIMKRTKWTTWTGANLTWGVEIQIVRGCLEDDPAVVAEAYERMFQEIKVVTPKEEGIQQDNSFHQHGAQLYNGGYGLSYANDVGRFVAFAHGTPFQIPPERMAILSSYLLDGEQWLVRGDVMDYSTIGREIVRKGKLAVSHDWAVGPLSPAGPAYGMGNVIKLLAAFPSPRQKEFQAFQARLQGEADAPEFTGNKQFWCSDFMAHRRKTFYTSVKMLSNRIMSGEEVIGEGKKSHHLSDGVNLLYLTGNEYKDIFPVWDWTALPGTTAIRGILNDGRKHVGMRGETAYAGGVSDGTYGMCAMDMRGRNLAAKKAWFFFDDSYVGLGAAIGSTGNPEEDVVTDVNQCHLDGDTFTSESKTPIPAALTHSRPAEPVGSITIT